MWQNDRLGRIGIWSGAWSRAYRSGDPNQVRPLADAAAELESLGYGALWLGSSPSVDFAASVLDSTSRLNVATGILNIWAYDAAEVARQHADITRRHPSRFLLGLGVSHRHFNPQYAQPYAQMQTYLSALDNAEEPVPPSQRVLAALGPKMLALSRDRAAGAHPYLVTEEHTAEARAILGPDPLLAPEFKVVLDADRGRALATARAFLTGYLGMPNYLASFRRLGFGDDDFAGGGSERLIDSLFAVGKPEDVARRVTAFLDAGANHVAVQIVTDSPASLPMPGWRALAAVLPLNR